MLQFSTKAAIERSRKGGKLLYLFANNPKVWQVVSIKKMTMIDVFLLAAAVASAAKTSKDKTNKKYQEE